MEASNGDCAFTANDLSTIYAPLLRDGRMDKFYWEPSPDDRVEMIYTMYREDGLSRSDIRTLMATFPQQPLDFFGALRSRQFDRAILHWRDSLTTDPDAAPGLVGKRIAAHIRGKEDALPSFEGLAEASLAELIEAGEDLALEQEHVLAFKLSQEYMKTMRRVDGSSGSLLGFR